MLVLSRKVGEKIHIGDNVVLTVVDILGGNKVRIGIEAPAEVKVYRQEIYDAIQAGQPTPAAQPK